MTETIRSYQFRHWRIREDMMGAIRRYIDHGINPGHFLAAVIDNDAAEAVNRADDESAANLPAFVAYFYNEAPPACWGSPEKRGAWVEAKRAGLKEDKACKAASSFEEFGRILCWRADSLVMTLVAYFDESGHSSDPNVRVVCVGGCVAPFESWQRFEPDWRAVLDEFQLTHFHMKHFTQRRGEFYGWSEEQRQDCLGKLLSLIDRDTTQYVVSACPIEVYRPENLPETLREPYYGCLIYSLKNTLVVAAEGGAGSVEVVIANQEEFRSMAQDLYYGCREELGEGQRLAEDPAFRPASQIGALQAADLVSWEVRKYLTDRDLRGETNYRCPLQQILRKGTRFMKRIRPRTEEERV